MLNQLLLALLLAGCVFFCWRIHAKSRRRQDSEERFRVFAELGSDWYWEQDENFRFTAVGGERQERFGAPPIDFIGKRRWDVPAPNLSEEDWARHRAVLDRHEPFRDFEIQRIGRDGSKGWVSVSGAPFFDARGRFKGYRGVGRDITKRKRAAELQRANADRIRDLIRRLIDAQEGERRRLAADLHDVVGQNLSALGIELGTLRGMLSCGKTRDAETALGVAARMVQDTASAVRLAMADLKPALLDDYGLLAAIECHAGNVERLTGLRVSVRGAIEPRPAREVELALFRIVQEALMNAVKHAVASRVTVELSRTGDALRIRVEDDGRGIAAAGTETEWIGGWGIDFMRERAEAIGGALRIECPGAGTLVTVEVPLGDSNNPG